MAVTACFSLKDLERLLLGQAAGQEMQDLEQHFLNCARCVDKVQALHAEDTLVQAMRSQTGLDVEPEPDIVAGLIQRITQTHPVSAPLEPTGQSLSADDEPTAGGTLASPFALAHDPTQAMARFLAPAQAKDEMGRLGGYRVLKVLGQGGMGVVFQAHDPNADRQIALKVMLPNVAAKPEARERFLREARATARIEHDHIVPLYQVSEDRGVPFLAMPLLKGMTLEDWLRKREQSKEPIKLAQILRLGREIAQGLAAAHERGLIHRDIKPANIWLDASANSRVKILDFGLARPAGDASLTTPGMIVGTASYMPPEQAHGEAVDVRADLYSLGCVLYRLCTGRLPYQGRDMMAVLVALTTEEAKPVRELNPGLPPPLADLVMGLLAKKPGGRPASARDVVKRLQELERKLTMTAEIAAPATAPPPRRRKGAWAAVLLLGVGALAAGAILYGMKSNRSADSGMTVASASVGIAPTGSMRTSTAVAVKRPTFAEWSTRVADLPGDQQVDAVIEELKKRNPNYVGKVKKKSFRPDGSVELLYLEVIGITDIEPLRVLKTLESLECRGPHGKTCDLANLTPLADLKKLKHLNIAYTRVQDLSPVAKLPLLERIECWNTPIRDLTPLVGIRRTGLVLSSTPLLELDAIGAMPDVTYLAIDSTRVKDLSPIKTLRKLSHFSCDGCDIRDLSPLKGLPLVDLTCPTDALSRNVAVLGGIGTLKTLNGKPAREELKRVALREMDFERWQQETKKLTPKEQVLAVVQKLKDLNPRTTAMTHYFFSKKTVQELSIGARALHDISPVRVLTGLKRLTFHTNEHNRGQLTDLSPLRDLTLSELHCGNSRVTDLSPLSAMTSLRKLSIDNSPVKDLTPLKDLKLRFLDCQNTDVVDLTPLRDVPLEDLRCSDELAVAQAPLLSSLPTLKSINSRPPEEFFKASKDFDLWSRATARLSGQKQLEAVIAKLKERNPAFDGKVVQKEIDERGVLVKLEFSSDGVTDLAPLRALTGLRWLQCSGSGVDASPLSDLAPLRGLRLEMLRVTMTRVHDLSPLTGMPLGMLYISDTLVDDLTPLQGAPLVRFHCQRTCVRDLTPLLKTPLQLLVCDFIAERDLAILRAIPTLENLNTRPVNEAFAKAEDSVAWLRLTARLKPKDLVEAVRQRMKEVNPRGGLQKLDTREQGGVITEVTLRSPEIANLLPLRAFTGLKRLTLSMSLKPSSVTDLCPLIGMDLESLSIAQSKVASLLPLEGMKLQLLICSSTLVKDLTPLRGMPLKVLHIDRTKVNNLSALCEMELEELYCEETSVTDLTFLRGMPLHILKCTIDPKRDASVLRSLKDLEKLNDRPARDVLKELPDK